MYNIGSNKEKFYNLTGEIKMHIKRYSTEKLEKEIRKIIDSYTPCCGTMVSIEDRIRNEIKQEQKMVDELVKLIQSETFIALLQEPPKLQVVNPERDTWLT